MPLCVVKGDVSTINAWYGFLGPAGLPADIVRKINADSRAIIARADFQERLARDGIEPVGNTPEQFAAQIKAEYEVYKQVVVKQKLQLD